MSELFDAAARERIRTDTGSTLFVEAGAGSGKTTALIDRVVTLVLDDDIALGSIAAVTFTEKAGAELRDRLRARFEKVLRRETGVRRDRAEAALDDLDSAAIGTLHSFAQRILLEHPIEAKLPPLLEVLDEVGSSVAFDERWAGLQTDLLDDDAIAEPLLLGMAAGVQLKHLRSIASLLGSDWDLIDDRILVGPDESIAMPDVSALIAEAARIAGGASDCGDADDKLLAKLTEIEEFGVLLAAAPDSETQLAVLGRLKGLKFGVGRQENWTNVTQTRDDCSALVAQADAVVGQVLDVCLRQLTRWIARRVLEAAQARRAEGRLEFHDLLVLARDLLRREESVRAALHHRYQRLLLDEFQDTDPIQIELAVRIAGGAAASAARWQDVAVPDGRLFVVGDPKQSIYRFRRASIATYLEAQDHLGHRVSLTTNFRTVSPVLDWLNAVFGRLIQAEPGGQPAYQALDDYRGAPTSGPAVTVLGAVAHTDLPRASASILREREAADVAAVVRRALDERWQVYDERAERWRDARLDDIAILVPARTSLPFLEEALESAEVAYRAEASSLVYQAGDVRDLLACARAIADTSDALSLVTALRSPLFGCGDDDLWRWKQARGSFSIFSRLDDEQPLAAGPVGSALGYLRRLHNDARWMTPSEVLGAIVADRRMLEVAATGPRSRDSWRRLRFVIDQARAWSEVSQGGLRGYLAWAAHQGEETSRVAEAVLPETDVNAVRVMTVHAAKGLEFPIVILSGLTSAPRVQSGVRILWPHEGGYAVKLKSGVQTGDFDALQPVDEQMDRLERLRLLYVATTRARDHLVVSLHRADSVKAQTNARLLAEAEGGSAAGAESFAGWESADGGGVSAAAAAPPPEFAVWRARLEAARASSRRAAAISASGLEGTEPAVALEPSDERLAGAAKGARDVDLPPWSKGRYGSAIGRAVHAVLQTIDLTDGSGLDAAVSAQCIAEGVSEYADVVTALVRSALGSELVKRAASRPHWRESYAGTLQPDGSILEGVLDLVYREDDGSLVIIDYKTDAIPAAALPVRAAYYRPQVDAYVRMLSDSTDALTVTAKLLFLNPSGAAVEAA